MYFKTLFMEGCIFDCSSSFQWVGRSSGVLHHLGQRKEGHVSYRDSSPWRSLRVSKCSSLVTERKRNEWLELFQRCFLEMGQGLEHGKSAKRRGFNTSSSVATSSQQLKDEFTDCFNQFKEVQRSCNNKPTGTCTGVSALQALSRLCISKWTVSQETSPCTGWNRPSWLTCCAPSHRLSSYTS